MQYRLLFACLGAASLSWQAPAQLAQANLGNVRVSASATSSITIPISSKGRLQTISVLTGGAEALDFANAGGGTCEAGQNYVSGLTCTVQVRFAPKQAGSRFGAVVLTDSNGNRMATAFINGVGQAPEISFLPGKESAVISGSQHTPQHVAVDGNGNVYLIDGANLTGSIWKESQGTTGYTQTSIGTGFVSPNGIAVDGAGDIYITDGYKARVIKETLTGSGYVQSTVLSIPPATYASVPYGITIDGSGNLYITDPANKRVLKETQVSGTYLQTVIPTAGLNSPSGIAVDGSGNLYIADTGNNRVVEEAAGATYTQSIVVSGLASPQGIAVDGNGNLYIADSVNGRVLRRAAGTKSILQTTTTGELIQPAGVAVDANGIVYIADSMSHKVIGQNFGAMPALNFAATNVGYTSVDSPQTITVSNLGNMALAFSQVAYASDFVQGTTGSDDCTQSTLLTTGQTCTLTVDFKPLSGTVGTAMNLSQNISVATNTLNLSSSKSSLSFTGTAISPPPVAATPVFSLASGTYAQTQVITLTGPTNGSTIYYTINGQTPTTSSTIYTAPLAVNQPVTVKAMAAVPGYASSLVSSATYTIVLPVSPEVVEAAPVAGYHLVLAEDFTHFDISPNGYGNHSWYPGLFFQPQQSIAGPIGVSSSGLTLDWTRPSHQYSTTIEGCAYDASHCNTFRYGYFEARMKWDVTTGAWPAFWMGTEQSILGQQHIGEIDIFEGQGNDPNHFYGTVNEWNGPSLVTSNSPTNCRFPLPAGNDFSQWHTYAVLWVPGKLTWYFDGQPVGSSTTPAILDQQNFFLMLGSQEGAQWQYGSLSGVTANSINLNVQWVDVYQQATLSGAVSQPATKIAEFETSSFDFGSVKVGSSRVSAQPIYLNNLGSMPVNVLGAKFSGSSDFTLASYRCSGGGLLMPPRGNCTIVLAFTPSAAGVRTGSLTVVDDAVGTTQTIALSGTGNP